MLSLKSNSVKKDSTKLISILSYLVSKNYKPEHIAAMVEFAKPRKMATLKQWEEIFSKY